MSLAGGDKIWNLSVDSIESPKNGWDHQENEYRTRYSLSISTTSLDAFFSVAASSAS